MCINFNIIEGTEFKSYDKNGYFWNKKCGWAQENPLRPPVLAECLAKYAMLPHMLYFDENMVGNPLASSGEHLCAQTDRAYDMLFSTFFDYTDDTPNGIFIL